MSKFDVSKIIQKQEVSVSLAPRKEETEGGPSPRRREADFVLARIDRESAR